MVTNWSIVSIWESIAGWMMGYDNKGHVLHSTASPVLLQHSDLTGF
jgi:hypothetical protein